jgi:hypothetical protein
VWVHVVGHARPLGWAGRLESRRRGTPTGELGGEVGELSADARGDRVAMYAEVAGDLEVVEALESEDDDAALARREVAEDLEAGLAPDEQIEEMGRLRLVDGALRPRPIAPEGRRLVHRSLSFGENRTYGGGA